MREMTEASWIRARLVLGVPHWLRPHFRFPSPGGAEGGEDAAVQAGQAGQERAASGAEAGGSASMRVAAVEAAIRSEASADAAGALSAPPSDAAVRPARAAPPVVPPPHYDLAGGARKTSLENPARLVAFPSAAAYDRSIQVEREVAPAPRQSPPEMHLPKPRLELAADVRAFMHYQNSNAQFEVLLDLAVRMSESLAADALMLLAEGAIDYEKLKRQAKDQKILLGMDTEMQAEAATKAGFPAVALGMEERPVHERISLALLACVADDVLKPAARVVVLYSGYENDKVDSLSVINLGEHLERLSASDLQRLEMRVPLDTLKKVVDLALEIGREGREGKPVGTIFVVGDHRKVLESSRSAGFDPVRGYSRKDRNLHDRRVREGIKEIAQLDGAFVVTADGHVAAACRILDATSTGITLPKGLGARHWAAAAITKVTRAVSVAVSESSGTVRLFQNGELMLRIEPFRRPMKWKDFHYEPPAPEIDKAANRARPATD